MAAQSNKSPNKGPVEYIWSKLTPAMKVAVVFFLAIFAIGLVSAVIAAAWRLVTLAVFFVFVMALYVLLFREADKV